jgi:hypothetical protein
MIDSKNRNGFCQSSLQINHGDNLLMLLVGFLFVPLLSNSAILGQLPGSLLNELRLSVGKQFDTVQQLIT